MRSKISGIMLILLLTSMLTLTFRPQKVESESAKEAPVVTSWSAPDGSLPTPFERWETGHLDATIGKISTGMEESSNICVIVDESIYGDLETYIDRYVSDLMNDGFNATVYTFSGGSEIDVKNLLENAYSDGLAGCLLVGDIPSAWYEMDSQWDPPPEPPKHEEFPMDLFYMDLDGEWADTDNDGMYDNHTGNRSPEIWVGRIKASGMAESEISLIQNYFDKNHNFRNGILSLPQRALIYIDDDWVDWSNTIDYSVSLAYENRTLVNNKATTEPSDYLSQLSQGWNLVQLLVHGWSGGHQFKINDEWDGYVYSSDIQSNDPNAFFYNLYSCSNARYIETDYIGGWYIFSNTYGVGAISSTKTGGMWLFDDFYQEFKNKTLGTSFSKWLTERISDEDANPGVWYDKRWYYGMTILGDPTLSRAPKLSPVVKMIPEVVDLGSGYVIGQNFSIAVVIENVFSLYGFDLQFGWNTTYIEYLSYTVTVPVEDYPYPIPPSPYAGTLHEPYMTLKKAVDESASIPGAQPGTMCWLSYSSMYGAPSFNGSGTVCVFNFFVHNQPYSYEDDVTILIHFITTSLANPQAQPIMHNAMDGLIKIPKRPPTVKTVPEVVDLGSGYVIGQNFSIAVVIENVSRLYGFDLQFGWNTTYIEYLDHTTTVSVEDYPYPIPPSPYAGTLHEPYMKLKDVVDEGGIPVAEPGTLAWFAYGSMWPAASFSGSGTVCVFTFRVRAQLIVDVEVPLHFIVTDMVDQTPSWIPCIVEDGLIRIPGLPPDIAVTNLSICYGTTVVPQNVSTWIKVIVTNEGSTSETFTLTVYWNSTNVIESTTAALLIGETKTVKFVWNTSTLQRYNNYTISAYATPVADEVDTVDNTYVGDTVILALPGDVDADKDVDLFDAVALLFSYGAKVGDPNYDPNLDIDNNGQIFLFDAVILLTHYGQKDS